MQRQAARGAAAGDGDERLREAVRSSAGQFREALQAQAAAAFPPLPGSWEAADAAAGRRMGAWQASPSKASLRAGRTSVSFSEAGSGRPSEDAGSGLRAMEAELARRQAALENQQRQLAQWAAELARREAELAQRQGGGTPPAAVQPSPPSAAAARAQAVLLQSPMVQRAMAGEPAFALAMGTPKHLAQQASGREDAAACTPTAAAAQGGEGALREWTEEFEEGVWTTWQLDDRGGKKLRRIRFSRTLFDKERASQVGERWGCWACCVISSLLFLVPLPLLLWPAV